ncbi:regulation of nuclear pre-mRNA domain-containing protein 2 isoform X2 [Episyrphus balteatus]|uniref:regulation of nuclear pre-mRNA domain-containing protein 2 isoform X2 n=1 Tax=Episyrphus balteatus TaxID=286459 RepID=UPI00248640D0|nr:regulation of nuclear pre-mRNA domain-containing protein 2 isoform X2 [Episyrphus balteatus]
MTNMKQDFDADQFETRLEHLKDTQDGIQQMSAWCLHQRAHHKKVVASWLNVFKKVRVEHRLVLFYLANDVIQYSKRKRYEFVESWATALQRATTMVRDDKVRNKIFRIFKIWEQRGIYSEEYLSDLSGLLSMNISKKSHASNNAEVIPDEFQSSALISNIRECVELSTATDKSFKNLPKAPNCDIENIKTALKDKSHSDDVEQELERYVASIEKQRKHLAAEIKSRKAVLANLETAITFYASQRGEVKVVVSAYKNFGSRIKLVKKKLDEITPNLPSPIPSPDINAPSPEPDSDINLPDEQSPSMNIFKSAFNGYTSYLDGKLPFDINDFKRDDSPKVPNALTASQPIEVIASRTDSDVLDDSFSGPGFYKPEPINSMASINPYSASTITLPMPTGQPEYSSLARPTSSNYVSPSLSYGGGHTSNRYNPMVPNYASDSSYISNSSNNSYDASMPLMPPPMPPSLGGNGSQSDDFNSTWDLDMSWTPLDSSNQFNHCIDTPISPGHFDQESILDDSVAEYDELENDIMPMQDVDHRQLHLPVPVAPPILPNLGPNKSRQLDIDHRNLISLTGSPRCRERDSDDKYKRVNKTWVAPSKDKDFRTPMSVNPPVKPPQEQQPQPQPPKTADIDYRTLSNSSTTENKALAAPAPPIPPLQPPPMLTGLLSFPQVLMAPPTEVKEDTQPQKDTAGRTSDEPGYDPSDMVESIDMDMSDEDLEDILREVASEDRQKALKEKEKELEQKQKQDKLPEPNQGQQDGEENKREEQDEEQNSQEPPSSEEYDAISNNEEYIPEEPTEEEEMNNTAGMPTKPFSYRDNLIPVANNRPPLLDTPPTPNNKIWDNQQPAHVNPFSRTPFDDQQPPNNGMHNNMMRPPMNPWKQQQQQPRMPFHMQQQQQQQPQDNFQQQMPHQGGNFHQSGEFHQPVDFQQHRQQFQRFPRSPFQQSPRNFNPHQPQSHFRGSPRPPRGNPFFSPRGRGGGPGGPPGGGGGPAPRGNMFRGKFRGNAWH